MIDIILKKRSGQALTKEEINLVISGFVKGQIPDYQMSALLMAIYFQKLNNEETSFLTEAMLHSGEVIDLTPLNTTVIDKHSTGGVGDKTTLVLTPLVASCGVPIAKMSGRGLGHTGGTLDKLEAIDGFHIELDIDSFIKQVQEIGIAVCGQTANLVPADKKIYALRDVTATVENVSLIASSIMSKKLASGADGIVIDIKIGDGAFMKTVDDGKTLAKIMKSIATSMNKNFTAVLTSMQQPLGNAIGNALEVIEAINTLHGKGPKDLMDVSLKLGVEMLLLSGKFHDEEVALQTLNDKINSGEAFEKFCALVAAQGGNVEQIRNTNELPSCKYTYDYCSIQAGYIHVIKASDIGLASMKLGAGRETKESKLNYGAGIILHKKVGDFVEKGDSICTLFADEPLLFEEAISYLQHAYVFGENKPIVEDLIYEVVR